MTTESLTVLLKTGVLLFSLCDNRVPVLCVLTHIDEQVTSPTGDAVNGWLRKEDKGQTNEALWQQSLSPGKQVPILPSCFLMTGINANTDNTLKLRQVSTARLWQAIETYSVKTKVDVVGHGGGIRGIFIRILKFLRVTIGEWWAPLAAFFDGALANWAPTYWKNLYELGVTPEQKARELAVKIENGGGCEIL